ncbi:MAG: transketolase C-terminal domain-containing protein [Candidatus Uhrbacteria bacterium]
MSTGNKPTCIDGFDTEELALLSALARKAVFETCLSADHGHVGGSSAAAELFVTLYFGGVLRINPNDPDDPNRDRVMVRGHLGPLRYKLFSWLGWIEESELATYRRIGSRLQGHEDHLVTPGVDMGPSGSLGMLLSYGVGIALGARDIKKDFRSFVFLGDGEEQEGVVSEAARHAAHLRLGNLIAIIDRNGKQLSNPVVDIDSSNLNKIWEGYGWKVINLTDGHDIGAILAAYREALNGASLFGTPTLIIADTKKGFGLEGFEEHFSGFHTMSRVSKQVVKDGVTAIEARLSCKKTSELLKRLGEVRHKDNQSGQHSSWKPVELDITPGPETPNHPDRCQFDYFVSLKALIRRGILKANDMYFFTADVTTKETVQHLGISEMFHFHNVGIREQHMIATAHGLSLTRPEARILINSFDAFTYRCFDQIHVALQGHGSMVIIGDVSGITNSRNGKTHQTTGLTAGLLSMEGLTLLEPWDAEDTFACLNWAIGYGRRVMYIRIHSSFVQCKPDKQIERTLTYYTVRDTNSTPDVVLVSSGPTVDSCILASDALQQDGINTRVINVVNPNSLDEGFSALVVAGRPLITVYNGHPRVLRQAVADALLQNRVHPSFIRGFGFTVGNTGTFDEILQWAELDSQGVYENIKRVLQNENF